ncbi:gluconate 2-dehydrogenase subunit 3 family protein [Algibacter mikhailovii]|uniref:gluconate 2-dehydrogenase subunit 3 family protein n=1 Tax=Algibacter mikhailovii TaxID=425498 RepID=UPI002494C2ED|nr:gluconate 2-dehydrogenase subunit 3 family protein [Algibacter mikhailovii]
MNRRDALKNLTMGLGYAVATPTIMNLLVSCKADVNEWAPLFLSQDEQFIVTQIVDVILPGSETPGGLDVNIPQFLDLMYHDIEIESNQKAFKEGAKLFTTSFNDIFKKEAVEGSKKEYNTIVSRYFDLSDEESEAVFKNQRKNQKNLSPTELKSYHLYKFLISIRYYCIFGYCTSEKIGEDILAYDPVPGAYNGCISLEEATNNRAWSL